MANYAYVAISLDGYIATSDGGIQWLLDIPNPDGSDYGFADFMARVDALLMGSHTYEKVVTFSQWPYDKPVYVLSHRPQIIPPHLTGKVHLVRGPIDQVISEMNAAGLHNLYVDGGHVIQSCLREDLIDELIITHVPILLGDGIPLFGKQSQAQAFSHHQTDVLQGNLVKSRYLRMRDGNALSRFISEASSHGGDSSEF